MLDFDDVVKELQHKRSRIDRAIQALTGVSSGTFPKRVQTKAPSPATQRRIAAASPRRTMSASARRRIAAAQRKRWAKIKAGKK